MPFHAQTRAGGFDAFFEATLHTDNNIVIPIENMLLIFNFLSSKVGRQRNCATQQRCPDSSGRCFAQPSPPPLFSPPLVTLVGNCWWGTAGGELLVGNYWWGTTGGELLVGKLNIGNASEIHTPTSNLRIQNNLHHYHYYYYYNKPHK